MSLSLADRQAILALLHQEVVPALGCTEPIAVALTAARAAEALGRKPERLDVAVSANLLKNGMGVMVPGTGEMGLAIAAAGARLAPALEVVRRGGQPVEYHLTVLVAKPDISAQRGCGKVTHQPKLTAQLVQLVAMPAVRQKHIALAGAEPILTRVRESRAY